MRRQKWCRKRHYDVKRGAVVRQEVAVEEDQDEGESKGEEEEDEDEDKPMRSPRLSAKVKGKRPAK